MQVSVESPSKLQRRVTITVPVDQMQSAFDNRLKKVAKTAKVKGFRPGNVPLAHVKQLYGDAVRQEALNDVIQSSLFDALQQEKLNPVGVPTIEPKALTLDQPLEYVAIFEVMPEIEEATFEAQSIEKHVATVSDADIDKVIKRLVEQYITWKPVERAAKEGDQVVMDFRGSIDGKAFKGGEAHDFPVIIGSKSMIPGFEEGLVGAKAKEQKIIQVTFPSDYFAAEYAGKAAEFVIDVLKVSEPEIPELNEELVKKFGISSGNADELRKEIKKNLDREVERLIRVKLNAKIFDLLIEQNNIDIPKAMIEQEATRIHDEMHPHHAGKEHNHTPAEMANFNDAAERNVKLGLLMGAIIKKYDIKPDDARVKEHINKLAASYEKPEEVIQWYYGDKRRLAEIEMLMLEEQATEKLLENVSVKEKVVSYEDLIKN